MRTGLDSDKQYPLGDADRQTASLAALAVALVLLVGGLFLAQTLRRSAQMEDCLMAGRINCDRILQR
jgi:hypothetical protein